MCLFWRLFYLNFVRSGFCGVVRSSVFRSLACVQFRASVVDLVKAMFEMIVFGSFEVVWVFVFFFFFVRIVFFLG